MENSTSYFQEMVNSMIYAGIDIANQTLVAAVVDSDCLIIMELFSLQTITMISSALKPSLILLTNPIAH